ncbi:phage virion morphogenesis protein [Marinobacterium iners]|uniref:Phage virion morphogenesis (Putative tail completion) protein n=1 Tax=Marinobacterium iners DSM 11526 TaxID=1122198 RepID=A0A1H3ZWD1_9GAMM|nr:phage virion morphogenesis protein [Marinobacterium iners]SEA27970.1 phage virion morphogenesis (putative tail completion) protein [Marinobacterium iners DSM 11526]
MSDLQRLETWATPLLEKLGPKERKRLARTISIELRRSQRQRIAEQRNPDGSAYAPRRGQAKTGRVRRKAMFTKLRTTKYLKAKYNANSVSTGFFGDIAILARVHHYGLRDRVAPSGPDVKYEQRELVGWTETDIDLVQDLLIEHLAAG